MNRMEPLINRFNFSVILPFENIYWTQDEKALMNQPSGLTYVCLYSNFKERKTRLLDFTDTTIEQAIRKILTFYKHRTFRRLLGENVYCNRFLYYDEVDGGVGETAHTGGWWCIVHGD